MKMQLQKVYPGSKILLLDENYEYSCVFYSMEVPEQYIYTYDYQKDQRWLTPVESEAMEHVRDKERMIRKEGYVQIAVTHKEGKELTEEERAGLSNIIRVENVGGEEKVSDRLKVFVSQPDVQKEIDRTVSTIRQKRNHDSLVFTLLSDTHYVINGNFEETAATIEAVNAQIKPDGIIHLGDLTDGMLNKEQCRCYSNRVLDRIHSWGLPFYFTIGNHDSNYFRSNPDRLTAEEQYNYYLKNIVNGELTENQLWYYQDLPNGKLRFIFLHSFDVEQEIRYGFPEEEVRWVKANLAQMPDDYRLIVFCHDAPLARLDYWAGEIRNGEMLVNMLEEWQECHGHRIMAYIHGHTHADYIYRERKFPIVSIGASKCEYFPDKKPEGSFRFRREMGTVLQELWDTMIIHPKEGSIDFVRFGAGEDRHIEPESRSRVCHTRIWAHRGASGYAPENTLEAFRLAHDMGADGIELDVQFTKDRQLVVIHDETIDRVSDGTGYVAEYTLEELKRFHFNKNHPEYTQAAIPTLREALELMKPTGMTVNIELKTGVNFYDGIERQVLKLVEEMEMQEQVIYSSFNHYSVMRIKRLSPAARVGILYCDGIYHAPDYAAELKAEALHPSLHNMQYPQYMEQCRDNGVHVHVWTVNNREDMRRMADMGVDAVITNYPDMAREVIYGAEMPEVRPYANKQSENADMEDSKPVRKNALLHGCGVMYSKVRKVFVKIDQAVQRAAGRRAGCK